MTSSLERPAARGRLLGVDLGARRVGVAIADSASGTIRPLTTLRRSDDVRDAEVLRRLAAEQGVTELVVGLPLTLDGREGSQATETRAWAAAMADRVGLPVTLRDERLTSVVSEARIGRPPRGSCGGPPTGRQRNERRARIDRESAVAILQAELDARSQGARA